METSSNHVVRAHARALLVALALTAMGTGASCVEVDDAVEGGARGAVPAWVEGQPAPTGRAASPPSAFTGGINALNLIDASRNATIRPLSSVDAIDLAALPSRRLSIEALPSGTVGSIVFLTNGTIRQVENIRPYAYKGDNGGRFNPWTPAVGTYVIVVTPYSQKNGRGTAGTPVTVTLTVVDSVTPPPFQPLPLPAASIEPQHVGVIVAEGDPLSEAIGAYYLSARGIPEANLVRVAIPASSDEIAATTFAPIKAAIDAGLPADVQATVLAFSRPSRVVGGCQMSITSALAFGYDSRFCGGCSATAPSPLYRARTARPFSDLGVRPSMMLAAGDLEAAQALIDRGVAADGTYPAGRGFAITTNDSARSGLRAADFRALPARWAFPGGLDVTYIDNSTNGARNSITGETDVLFYFTGLTRVDDLVTNQYRPGAIADHVTSFGGVLPDGYGQMPIVAWLAGGVTGSYGTVEEPCAIREKFPVASVAVESYFRGATLIESYWKSVEWPGQGLFVGEPLARPFLDPASSTIVQGEYVVTTRAFERDSRYGAQYRPTPSSPWVTLADFVVDAPGERTARAPLAPIAAAEVRVVGPCPHAVARFAPKPVPYTYVRDAAGRLVRVDVVYEVENRDDSGCGDKLVDVGVTGLAPSLSAQAVPASLAVPPGSTREVVIQVTVPPGGGPTGAPTLPSVSLRDARVDRPAGTAVLPVGGPCQPVGLSARQVSITPFIQAGRTQRVAPQVRAVADLDPTCTERTIAVSVEGLPEGWTGAAQPPVFPLGAASITFPILDLVTSAIDVPERTVVRPNVRFTDTATGESTIIPVSVLVLPSSFATFPPLRIVRPLTGYFVPDLTGGPLLVPLEADLRPGSAIARVRFTITDANGVFVAEVSATAPFAATAEIAAPVPGSFYLVAATGEDATGATVGSASSSFTVIRL